MRLIISQHHIEGQFLPCLSTEALPGSPVLNAAVKVGSQGLIWTAVDADSVRSILAYIQKSVYKYS